MYRTNTCGELRLANVGQTVTLAGWVQRSRDLGGMTFIDLRDRYGITQLAFNMETNAPLCEQARKLGREYVIQVTGKVIERSSKNSKIPTGEIEIEVIELTILNEAKVPPFTIEDQSDGGDDLRMRYRYLDIRRNPVKNNLVMRHRMAMLVRNYLSDRDFLEIETPMLIKSTPEGARDFVVPSRMNPGEFYALPQSPQQYKQLLMVAGMDRYFQIVRCFRDEDLRADRQPEFTQVDFEMSFVDAEDIQTCVEGYMARLFKEVLGEEIALPLPRLTFKDAMDRYGSDKPDTRFGFEIQDISEVVKDIDFVVFKDALAGGGSVRAINVTDGAATYTRKEIDKLVEHAKGIGAKGLAYIRWADEANCSFKKFLGEGDLERICEAVGAKQGDLVLICADKNKVVLPTLGAIRLICGKRLGVIDESKHNFLWITEMPFFEYDEDTGAWVAAHHPFTMPMEECLDYLDTDPANVRAKAWDLVLNGTELSSGSMRITDFELQQKMFEALGMTDEEIEAKFGFLVDAYRYAAPPHGGMGIGLDRISMIMCGADSLRDVVAFPKVQNASELMSECPSTVDTKQLDELHIAIKE